MQPLRTLLHGARRVGSVLWCTPNSACVQRADIHTITREQLRKAAIEKRRRLEIAEVLLWHMEEGRSAGRKSGFCERLDAVLWWLPSSCRARWLYSTAYKGMGTCVHLAASFALEGCAMAAQNVSLTLFQDSVPGPFSQGETWVSP